MYEAKHEHPIPVKKFITRLANNFVIGLSIVAASLGGGMIGYHHYENMPWIDAYVNAAMILSGMGPVLTVQTNEGKLFAGTYALFSGIVFLIVIAIILAPVFHRFLHNFHFVQKDDK